MSDRFFLSEEEITRKYGKSITTITLRGGWEHSDVYYDAENDCFIEERYHEEYLDTGTVCDGCFPLTDSMLWDQLVETCNEEGMSAYLKIRKQSPMKKRQGETISMDVFHEGIYALRQDNPWRRYHYEQIGSVIIIEDEAKTILGVVGKSDEYCFFYDSNSDRKRKGFHTWGEALAEALKRVTYYHNIRVKNDRVVQQKNSEESISVSAESSSKVCFFKKLFGRK